MANAATNTKGKEESFTDKAKDAASTVADKAKQAASTVADKARDVAANVGDTADSTVSSVGSGMQSLAGSIRDKAPSSGMFGGAASGVASTLETSGRYLEEEGLSGIGQDLTNLIRKNPIPAVLIGLGLGFLLARITPELIMATDLRNGTEPSMTELVKGVLDDVQTLTRQQLTLFKQELEEDFAKTRHAALPMLIGLGVMLIGTLLFGISLGLLLEWAFRPHMPLWVAFLIVTVLMGGTGFGLFYAGQKKFETFNPLPDRTLDALKENAQSLTGAPKP